jgi:hypothetical protein
MWSCPGASARTCQYRRLRCRDARADLDRIINDLIVSDPDLVLAARRRRLAQVQPSPTTDPAAGSTVPRWTAMIPWTAMISPDRPPAGRRQAAPAVRRCAPLSSRVRDPAGFGNFL